MNWALVNGDYEFELYADEVGPTPRERIIKNRNDVEFTFFYINQDRNLGLHSTQNYQDEFLRHIEDLGFTVPAIREVSNPVPWYGALRESPKEKKLNSKLWSYRLAESLGVHHAPYWIVDSKTQAQEILHQHGGTQKWLLKSPFLMSGVGFTKIDHESQVPDLGYAHILEPYLERIVDISYLLDHRSGEQYFYLNKASPTGQYLGGAIFESPFELERYLAARGLKDEYAAFRTQALKVIDALKAERPTQMTSFDGFIYLKDGRPHLQTLCDINYRQSMGSLMWHLKRLLPRDGYGEFYILNKPKNLIDQSFHPYSSKDSRGILYLTHPNAPNLALFISGKDVSDTVMMRKKFFFHVS